MSSAPEHADRVVNRTLRCSAEQRTALAFTWIDRGVRQHVAGAVSAAHLHDAAEDLSGLPPIRTVDDLLVANALLTRLAGTLSSSRLDLMSAIFCLAANLKTAADVNDLMNVSVVTITAARLLGVGATEEAQQTSDTDQGVH
ncbi:MAG: hypothetical protein HYS27_25435 [Deltaproteobacteria bacterium]|nr:hypothetical protein [Deltaproteobacteria bacterium]